MDFAIGQAIVHPSHGPGTIVDIEENELVKGYHKFYVIEFARDRLTIHVPLRRVNEIGVREVMSPERYRRVLKTLRALPEHLQNDFKDRRHRINQLLCSGSPGQVASAVRDLTWRKFERHLTKADSEQLSKGREMLAAEVALVTDADIQSAEQTINEAVAEGVAAKQALLEKESQEQESQEQATR